MLRKSFSKLNLFHQIRNLSLQENVAMTILNDNGITTPKFRVAKNDKEAEQGAKDLLTKNLMVKAQVLAGGRGLGRFENGFQGGVHAAINPSQVKYLASKMIGKRLITKQTTENGILCNSVMVSERKFPRREFYFAFALDREQGGPVLIASCRGGVNIEDVAKQTPNAIIYQKIDPEKGFTKEIADWILRRVGITDQPVHACKMLCRLYELFIAKDCLLAEINPYVEDVCLNYFPLDVKIIFDDNAEFRQREIFEKRDESQEEAKELTARKLGMSYVSLDGSIGLMVNGAGLAMASVDILSFYGGEAANFLDIGTMSSPNQITEAVKVIMMDPKVRTIFVNIFGGMNKCDDVAEGLLKAIRELDIKIPIVARIEGNNFEKGRKMLQNANLNVISSESFDDAAMMAVRCAKIVSLAECGNLDAKLSMKMQCECEPGILLPCDENSEQKKFNSPIVPNEKL